MKSLHADLFCCDEAYRMKLSRSHDSMRSKSWLILDELSEEHTSLPRLKHDRLCCGQTPLFILVHPTEMRHGLESDHLPLSLTHSLSHAPGRVRERLPYLGLASVSVTFIQASSIELRKPSAKLGGCAPCSHSASHGLTVLRCCDGVVRTAGDRSSRKMALG